MPRLAWELLGTLAVGTCAWLLAQYVLLPRLPRPSPPVVQTLAQETPATPTTGTDVNHTQPQTSAGVSRYWSDPSLDPDVLKRAYAPVSEPLPPEARPKSPAIHPPEREWRRLKRKEEALAY
jgi:hypothetical protein